MNYVVSSDVYISYTNKHAIWSHFLKNFFEINFSDTVIVFSLLMQRKNTPVNYISPYTKKRPNHLATQPFSILN